jgi:hypothetical protein
LGEIGLLGDDLIERLTTGATRMGYIGMAVFLILLVVGWVTRAGNRESKE